MPTMLACAWVSITILLIDSMVILSDASVTVTDGDSIESLSTFPSVPLPAGVLIMLNSLQFQFSFNNYIYIYNSRLDGAVL